MTWRVRHSRIIHQDRWISLRADDCVTDGGVAISPYYVLDYPDFVHALALDPAGRVVLVRQYRHGAKSLSLELPGGVMDPGEADPVAAAMRELREETGFTSPSARLIASLSGDPAKMGNRTHLVLAEAALAEHSPAPDETEGVSVVLLPVADSLELALSGGILHAAHVAFLLMGLRACGRLTLSMGKNG